MPVPRGYQDSTGWKIPNLELANHSREPLFVSGVYYFSGEWANYASGKFLDFSLHEDESIPGRDDVRISPLLTGGGDEPSFDGRTGKRFELNRGGGGHGFRGRSNGIDNGLFLDDVAGKWFWLGYYIDFENNRVSAYVKTGPGGPYPVVTRVLHRTNNNLLIGARLHRHRWVPGETITGLTSGATAIVDDYNYDGLIITPLSGDFIDLFDVDHYGVQGELIVGSQSGTWSEPVAAQNWNWDRTTEGLAHGFSGIINGYYHVKTSVPVTAEMCHIADQVAVGNGWIDPPTFPASEPDDDLNWRCLDD
jgi:hypothetical protein